MGPGYRPGSRSPKPRTSARTVTLPQPVRPLAVSALRPSLPPREGRGTRRGCGVWGVGGGGAPERTCRLGRRPASRLRARRASSAISRRGRCGGSAASLGAGGGRRGRAPASGREPARLLRTPGVRLARGFCSPFGGVLALVCEPLFRTGPANENKNQTGHTFQRDGSWL